MGGAFPDNCKQYYELGVGMCGEGICVSDPARRQGKDLREGGGGEAGEGGGRPWDERGLGERQMATWPRQPSRHIAFREPDELSDPDLGLDLYLDLEG